MKDVRVEHRMASIADSFNFDEGTLVGSLDFINEPGRFRLDMRIVFTDGKEQTVRLEFMVVSVKMKHLALHPFFRGVSNFEGFRQQSLVLQKSAEYAQILTAWLKLKSVLKLGGDDIDVSYRSISTLYEFWRFFKMRDFLKARFGESVSAEWADVAASEIFDAPELTYAYTGGGQLCKIDVTFKDGGRTYLLSY